MPRDSRAPTASLSGAGHEDCVKTKIETRDDEEELVSADACNCSHHLNKQASRLLNILHQIKVTWRPRSPSNAPRKVLSHFCEEILDLNVIHFFGLNCSMSGTGSNFPPNTDSRSTRLYGNHSDMASLIIYTVTKY